MRFLAGRIVQDLGLAIIVAGVIVSPWLLGGAIPHAILACQTTALVGTLLALTSVVLTKEPLGRTPPIVFPLFAFAAIAVIQLAPIYPHPLTRMQHAVNPLEVDPSLLAVAPVLSSTTQPRSVLPADTRLALSHVLTLTLVAQCIPLVARTRRHITGILLALSANGCLMTVLEFMRRPDTNHVLIGNAWKVSEQTPFGCFVNPNNAASWLAVSLAASFCLLQQSLMSANPGLMPDRRMSASLGSIMSESLNRALKFASDLKPNTLVCLGMTIILLSGICLTRSRAGIAASAIGVFVFLCCQRHTSRIVTGGALALLLGAGVTLFLSLFEERDSVALELATVRNLNTDFTGRFRHWCDSLACVLDFPVIGAGLGSYRFSSLPFQTTYTASWFQRADNMYVELLVEAGVAGLSAILVCSGMAVSGSFRAAMATPRSSADAGTTARVLGRGVLAAATAICATAFFDYGASLISVSSSLVLFYSLIAVARSVDTASGSDRIRRHDPGRSSQLTTRCVIIASMFSSASLVRDSVVAAQGYECLADIERQLHKPVRDTISTTGPLLLDRVDRYVAARSDDWNGHRLRVLFTELLFRNELAVDVLNTRADSSVGGYENTMRALTPFRLARSLLATDRNSDTFQDAVSTIESSASTYPWSSRGGEVLSKMPHIPEVAANGCCYDLGMRRASHPLAFARLLAFSQPASARLNAQTGELFWLSGFPDAADVLWHASLDASNEFRANILITAITSIDLDDAMRRYGPTSFGACVDTMLRVRTDRSPLSERLNLVAEQLWQRLPLPHAEADELSRALMLEVQQSSDAASKWLQECLDRNPDRAKLRRMRARILTRKDDRVAAYDEWLILLADIPGDPEAISMLEELRQRR